MDNQLQSRDLTAAEMSSAPHRSLLDQVVRRHPLDGFRARSGSRLERVELVDGTVLVVKHISPHDWIAKAAADPGRAATLFTSGVLAHLPAGLDHAIVAVEPADDDRRDPRTLELAFVSALMQLGWRRALAVHTAPYEDERAATRAELDWWYRRVRLALENW